jgi:hypothetical protein
LILCPSSFAVISVKERRRRRGQPDWTPSEDNHPFRCAAAVANAPGLEIEVIDIGAVAYLKTLDRKQIDASADREICATASASFPGVAALTAREW